MRNLVIPSINCSNFACVKERIKIASNLFAWALFRRRRTRLWRAHALAEERYSHAWVHIDVSDGKFTPHISWNNPAELASILRVYETLRIEVHLMVDDPEAQIDAWLRAGAKRIIVHLEAMRDPIYIIERCKKYGVECFLAINPATELERLLVHLDDPRTKSPTRQPGDLSRSAAKDIVDVGVAPGGALVRGSAPRGREVLSHDSGALHFDGVLILGVFPGPSGQAMKPEVINKIKYLRENNPEMVIEIDGGVNLETAKRAKTAGANLFVAGNFIFGSKNPAKSYADLKRAVV